MERKRKCVRCRDETDVQMHRRKSKKRKYLCTHMVIISLFWVSGRSNFAEFSGILTNCTMWCLQWCNSCLSFSSSIGSCSAPWKTFADKLNFRIGSKKLIFIILLVWEISLYFCDPTLMHVNLGRLIKLIRVYD